MLTVYDLSHSGFLVDLVNFNYLSKKDMTLLLVDLHDNFIKIPELIESNLFSYVEGYDSSKIYTEQDCDEIERYLTQYYDSLLSKYVKLSPDIEYYTAPDNISPFGVYLSLKGIKYKVLEINKDAFQQPLRYRHRYDAKLISKSFFDLQEKNNVLIPMDEDSKVYYCGNKNNSFDYIGAYKKINATTIASIFKLFKINENTFEKIENLVLTNSPGFLYGSKIEKKYFKLLYAMIIDFHGRSNTQDYVLKLHPHMQLYKSLFSGIETLDGSFNMELINYTNYTIKTVIFVQTSTIEKIQDHVCNLIQIPGYYKDFYNMPMIYTAIFLSIKLKKTIELPKKIVETYYDCYNLINHNTEAHSTQCGIIEINDEQVKNHKYLYLIKTNIRLNSSECVLSKTFLIYANDYPTYSYLYDCINTNFNFKGHYITVSHEFISPNSLNEIEYSRSFIIHICTQLATKHNMLNMLSIGDCIRTNPKLLAYLGKVYYLPNLKGKNLKMAAVCLKKSLPYKVPWARNVYCDVLWEINTADSNQEMISLLMTASNYGDYTAMGRLARAYRYGRGVPKNTQLAIKWYEESIKGGPWWLNEYLNYKKTLPNKEIT